MLIDVIAATIHRTPVLGFCMGAPRKRRPSQPRLLLKTYVYQAARPRTMGSLPFGKQHEWAMLEHCEMITKKGIESRPVKSIRPRGADKIYDRLTLGPKTKTSIVRTGLSSEQIVFQSLGKQRALAAVIANDKARHRMLPSNHRRIISLRGRFQTV
jgi:hypothetical protein